MRVWSIALGVMLSFASGRVAWAEELSSLPPTGPTSSVPAPGMDPSDAGAEPTPISPEPASPAAAPSTESVIDRVTPFIASIDVHGFVTQAALKTTGNNFLVPDSKTGS